MEVIERIYHDSNLTEAFARESTIGKYIGARYICHCTCDDITTEFSHQFRKFGVRCLTARLGEGAPILGAAEVASFSITEIQRIRIAIVAVLGRFIIVIEFWFIFWFASREGTSNARAIVCVFFTECVSSCDWVSTSIRLAIQVRPRLLQEYFRFVGFPLGSAEHSSGFAAVAHRHLLVGEKVPLRVVVAWRQVVFVVV